VYAVAAAICFLGIAPGIAQQIPPTSVYLQTPAVSTTATTNVTSPVHFQATAESTYGITGYAIYVDGNQAYLSNLTTLDTWVVMSSGTHNIHVTAWDSTGGYLTIPSQNTNYSINVTGFAPPTPPPAALQLNVDRSYSWAKQPGAGGVCATGTIATWSSLSDPNTANAPDPTGGQHFTESNAGCLNAEDNTLFAWKDANDATNAHTNFLWDFWFYVPTSTNPNYVQALESDLFFVVKVNDGNVHEFMFGSQCYYNGSSHSDYWQFAYPQSNHWSDSSDSCQPTRPETGALQAFSEGIWHHVTWFYQRVTPNGSSPAYQHIVNNPTYSTDTNTEGLFGTLTIDGYTYYVGQIVQSSIPGWTPVLGVQHQLDMPALGSTQSIDEYVDQETVYTW